MRSRNSRDDDDHAAGEDARHGRHTPAVGPGDATAPSDPSNAGGPSTAGDPSTAGGPGAAGTAWAHERPAREPGAPEGHAPELAAPEPAAPGDHVPPPAEHEPPPPAPDRDRPQQDRPAPRDRRDVQPAWLRTSAVVVGSVLLLVLLLVIAAATLPSWWARTVGGQVDGVPAAGTLWGLFYGVTFTLIPLVLAVVALRTRWPWKVRVGIGVAALVALLPNLLTLAVAIGASERTRAARTVMVVQAPNFRVATLIGAVVTLVLGTAVSLLIHRMTASRRELAELRKQAKPN